MVAEPLLWIKNVIVKGEKMTEGTGATLAFRWERSNRYLQGKWFKSKNAKRKYDMPQNVWNFDEYFIFEDMDIILNVTYFQ